MNEKSREEGKKSECWKKTGAFVHVGYICKLFHCYSRKSIQLGLKKKKLITRSFSWFLKRNAGLHEYAVIRNHPCFISPWCFRVSKPTYMFILTERSKHQHVAQGLIEPTCAAHSHHCALLRMALLYHGLPLWLTCCFHTMLLQRGKWVNHSSLGKWE